METLIEIAASRTAPTPPLPQSFDMAIQETNQTFSYQLYSAHPESRS